MAKKFIEFRDHTGLLFLMPSLSWHRLRAELNKNLEASQKKGGPAKKVSLNDFVIKVRFFQPSQSCNKMLIRKARAISYSFGCPGRSIGVEEGTRGEQFLD